MNKNNKQAGFSGIAAIGIVAAVVAVVIMFGYYVNSKKSQKDDMVAPVANTTEQESKTVEGEGWKAEEGEKINVESTNEVSTSEQTNGAVGQDTVKASSGLYVAYSADKIAMAATGDVVLFFHAPWCPSCRALNGDIEKNMSAIPAGVTILKTDYDEETELKKKYGVTTQHTLVQVDKDGNLIKKWSGGSKLDNLLLQIQ